MTSVTIHENGEGRQWVWSFLEGEEARQLHNVGGGRLNEEQRSSVWRSKMIKGSWVIGLNTRLSRTADWVGEKI
jgi:hypothetical protein